MESRAAIAQPSKIDRLMVGFSYARNAAVMAKTANRTCNEYERAMRASSKTSGDTHHSAKNQARDSAC